MMSFAGLYTCIYFVLAVSFLPRNAMILNETRRFFLEKILKKSTMCMCDRC